MLGERVIKGEGERPRERREGKGDLKTNNQIQAAEHILQNPAELVCDIVVVGAGGDGRSKGSYNAETADRAEERRTYLVAVGGGFDVFSAVP